MFVYCLLFLNILGFTRAHCHLSLKLFGIMMQPCLEHVQSIVRRSSRAGNPEMLDGVDSAGFDAKLLCPNFRSFCPIPSIYTVATTLSMSFESFLLVPVGHSANSWRQILTRKRSTVENLVLLSGLFLLVGLFAAIQ